MSEIKASPSVRARANAAGIDLDARARALGRTTLGHEDLAAEGPSDAAAPAAPAPVASDATRYWDVDHAQYGPVTHEPMSRIAQAAARNLAAAQALIPAVTHHDHARTDRIEALRTAWKDEGRARGVKLTALAFHVVALSRCLRDFPRFNASLTPDGETLVLKNYVHVGIAVDTAYGLIVPVIREADRKGLWAIAAEIADLAGRAQARKIRPDEMGGASMTISNLGGIGGAGFTPIVNPPEVAILGLTRTETATEWIDGGPAPVARVPLDLSYDHRVINGADAARFLRTYAGYLEEPRRLLI
ncbi:Dihydrolipoyllysine-residue acetyltransferase component of pyruvate dehydrogenase complex [Roseivivax jejudonensis]|uniref:Dihydrolipoyllysine-residue acetyltransferase component of pyruvate dehydrogenase complex n=1 Tax=Roseivivax jejudonensis TaxID=1529041 RepID=A0A1X6YXP5_9RHOB|nr:2-oxo acid dehydrogenase subunit E2 [Roseivivax jejudonensis]SLN34207.1 Dihydrolipoyllysine-residue acetyltransferase component of pyruvate dehydrogenase complex [Roseivivax jejudonensis]